MRKFFLSLKRIVLSFDLFISLKRFELNLCERTLEILYVGPKPGEGFICYTSGRSRIVSWNQIRIGRISFSFEFPFKKKINKQAFGLFSTNPKDGLETQVELREEKRNDDN